MTGARASLAVGLGVFCLIAILLCGLLSVAHVHQQGAMHADCGLCVTAHSAAQAVVLPDQTLEANVRASVAPASALPPIDQRFSFAQFTRPPPR